MVIRLENVALPDSYPAASSLTIRGAVIAAVGPDDTAPDLAIDLSGALAFPGLVNGHDHLEFNLFPALRGDGVHGDYLEWGADIQHRHRAVIARVLRIPAAQRMRWGMFKNLLAGVTSVIHHGALPPADPLIDVPGRYRYLHSLGFHRRWPLRLASPFDRRPVLVHIAEGTSARAAAEPDRLTRWNWWGADLIGIHGIAMSPKQARRWKAVIWCPVSNLFLYGQTAPVQQLKSSTAILFGTDSTLSAGWNLWDHLRVARQIGALTDAELYASLTDGPARVFRDLGSGGTLAPGRRADIVVARRRQPADGSFLQAFFGLNPQDLMLVIRRGRILLFDESLRLTSPASDGARYDRVRVGDAIKMVAGGIADLVRDLERKLGHDPGGEPAGNPGELALPVTVD
jgi:cytosine/adenosine deaminase-related metal-dependent hydrolase